MGAGQASIAGSA